MRARITTERARALLAGDLSPGPWTWRYDGSAMCRAIECPARYEEETRVAETCSSSDDDAALIAAAPDLAADLIAAREIIEGRTTPPTDAEMREHMDAGGAWLVTIPARKQVRLHPETRYVDDARAASLLWWTEGARWVAVRDGRPCAWPVVPAEGARS